MTLPILNTPTYEITVPSTKQSIEFRPFLVKEEKLLFMAQESKDQAEILKILKDIVRACTFEKINPDELTSYDLEYIFLKLRGKSVGEIISIEVKCQYCGAVNPLDINIDDVHIKYPEKKVDSKIQLTSDVGITVRSVPVKELSMLSNNEDFVQAIALCIDTIFTGEKVYHRNEVSMKELTDFVESLSHNHVKMIEEFISNQPKLEHVITYTCHNCGKENRIVLSGLQDFFN